MVKLTVDSSTTLADLKAFADQAGDGDKIRGKENKDGTVTLYSSSKGKGTGFKDYFSNHSAKRQAAGQTAIRSLLESVRGPGADALMKPVLGRMPGSGQEMRGADFSKLVSDTIGVRDGVLADMKTPDGIADTLLMAANPKAGLADTEKQALTEKLGDQLASSLRNLPRDKQQVLAMQEDDKLADAMLRKIADKRPEDAPALKFGAAPEMLTAAFRHALTQVSDHRVDDTHFVLDGKTYAFEASLGSGGAGEVHLYKAADSDDTVVVKIQKYGMSMTPDNELAADSRHEARTHARAVVGDPNHEHVVGFRGAVRDPHGGVMIVLDKAEKGDAKGVWGGLDEKVASDELKPDQAVLAKLTMVKDMAAALHHYNEVRGMSHFDVKGENFFVDGKGVTVLADFGTGADKTSQDFTDLAVGTPQYQPAEASGGRGIKKEKVEKFVADMELAKQQSVANLDQGLSDDEKQIAKDNISNISRAYDQLVAQFKRDAAFTVTNAADTWALGIEVYTMFTGNYPFPLNDYNAAVERFGADPNNRIVLPDAVPEGISREDWQKLSDLVERMLHPDPAQRPSMKEVLESELLSHPRVGGPAARDILANL